MRRLTSIGLVWAAVMLGAVALTACGSSQTTKSTPNQGSGGSTTTATNGAKEPVSAQSIKLALQYTQGAKGPAKPGATPFIVGYANQEGTVPSLPEQRHAAQAAADFINEHLGGVAGHPIKLVPCIIQTAADGQKCGQMFANTPGLKLVVVGDVVFGDAAMYNAIHGKVPVIVSVEGGPADETTPHVYELDGGGAALGGALPRVAVGMLHAKKVALLYSSNPVGIFLEQHVVVPALKKAGVQVTAVSISDSATGPEMTSALSSAGGTTADAVGAIFAPSSCIPLYDAVKQLQITAPVVTFYSCYADSVVQHVGGAENLKNWYFIGFTSDPHSTTPEAQAFRNVMSAYGQGAYTYQGTSANGFGAMLTVAKLGNELGSANLTPANLEGKIKTFTGPQWMQPGRLGCGQIPGFSGLCGDSVALTRYENGAWRDLGGVQVVHLQH
jgi:branched-chain amino acid transport system substrate-binding protein